MIHDGKGLTFYDGPRSLTSLEDFVLNNTKAHHASAGCGDVAVTEQTLDEIFREDPGVDRCLLVSIFVLLALALHRIFAGCRGAS